MLQVQRKAWGVYGRVYMTKGLGLLGFKLRFRAVRLTGL